MKHRNTSSISVQKFCAWMGRQHFLSGPLDWVSRRIVDLPAPLAWSVPAGFQYADAHAGRELVQGPAMFLDFIARGVDHAVEAVSEVYSEVQRRVREAKGSGASPPPGNPCKEARYSGMHGSPCKYNNGSDLKCPAGTVSGYWWTRTTAAGEIYYVDCCGGSQISSVWCDNSSEPNWCLGPGRAQKSGRTKYTCTLAIPKTLMKYDSNGWVAGVDP